VFIRKKAGRQPATEVLAGTGVGGKCRTFLIPFQDEVVLRDDNGKVLIQEKLQGYYKTRGVRKT